MVKLRSNKLKNGTKSYYLDISHNGNRWTERLELYASRGNAQTIKEQAEHMRSKRQQELSVSSKDLTYIVARKKSFLEFYITFEENYPKKDKRNLTGSLKKFKIFLRDELRKDDILFPDLDEDICMAYRNYLVNDAGLRGETPANYFSKFKLTVKEAKKKKFIKNLPTEFITLGKEDGAPTAKKEVLEIHEIEKLINTACDDEQVKRSFLFCCFTGLRAHEMKALSGSMVNYKQVEIQEEDKLVKKQVPHITVEQTKGKRPKPKSIPLSAEAFWLLGDFSENADTPIFNLPSDPTANSILANWVKRAKIGKHITFYCGRHTFGTELVAQGVDLRTVASLLGHSSLKHLMRYSHEVDKNKLKAINTLAAIVRRTTSKE